MMDDNRRRCRHATEKLLDELYDLEADIGEKENRFADFPEVVADLSALADGCRRELGDAHTGVEGAGSRPAARVQTPTTLTSMDQMDPIIRAMYD